jgi:translation initiation factor 3 subunit F
MGVSAKPDNCTFVPIPVFLRQVDAERPGCTYRSGSVPRHPSHLFLVNLLKTASEAPNQTTPVLSDLHNLEQSLLDVVSMIERVQTYVQSVIEGDIEGDPAIGRFLLDTLNITTEGLEKGKLESLFNTHVQVRAALHAYTQLTPNAYRTLSWSHIWPISSDHRQKFPPG